MNGAGDDVIGEACVGCRQEPCVCFNCAACNRPMATIHYSYGDVTLCEHCEFDGD